MSVKYFQQVEKFQNERERDCFELITFLQICTLLGVKFLCLKMFE